MTTTAMLTAPEIPADAVVMSASSADKPGTITRLHTVRLCHGEGKARRIWIKERLPLATAWALVNGHPHRDGLVVRLDPAE